MDTFVDFLINNYLWVVIIALILIFALIGYLVDSATPKSSKKIKEISSGTKVLDKHVHPSVEVYTNDQFDEPLMNDKNA